jgi:hypothetical protein
MAAFNVDRVASDAMTSRMVSPDANELSNKGSRADRTFMVINAVERIVCVSREIKRTDPF